MSHCTHQTSLALKEAGFPQPDFVFGQLWASSPYNYAVIVAEGYYSKKGATYGFNTHRWAFSEEARILLPSWCFAPTAQDIMVLLPGFSLEWVETPAYSEGLRTPDLDINFWLCYESDSGDIFDHPTNAAEAAARAWLKQNAPNQTFVQPGDAEQE